MASTLEFCFYEITKFVSSKNTLVQIHFRCFTSLSSLKVYTKYNETRLFKVMIYIRQAAK